MTALATLSAERPTRMAPARNPRSDTALQIFDRVPAGFLAHAATDNSALPLIGQGEVAVIDPNDFQPTDGGIFVIAWRSPRVRSARGGAEWHIVETYETTRGLPGWWAGRLQPGAFKDGPYESWQLAEMLVGRVVGLYRPRGNA